MNVANKSRNQRPLHISEKASRAARSIPHGLAAGIAVLNKQGKIKIDRKAAALFCTGLLQSLKRTGYTLSVAFVGASTIRSINRIYRGKDNATDVLSFSYGRTSWEGTPFLGEIIVAPAVAVNNARHFGIPAETEVRKLLTHGTLHLLGYDHETDRGQMNQMQARLMRRKFFSMPPLLTQKKAIR